MMSYRCGICGTTERADDRHSCGGTVTFQPSCFHCYCGKQPLLTGQPEHITCCKCGERLAVNVAYSP